MLQRLQITSDYRVLGCQIVTYSFLAARRRNLRFCVKGLQPTVMEWLSKLPSFKQSSELPSQRGNKTGVKPVTEVFENQRYFGIAWTEPLAALDQPSWTDGNDAPILFVDGDSPVANPDAWEYVVDGTTDDCGWKYATVFSHLHNPREGGRSSQRFGDSVRHRKWRRKDQGPSAQASALPVSVQQRREEDSGRRSKAIRGFIKLVLDLLQRRQLLYLVPWDPTAPMALSRIHTAAYRTLRSQAAERRLFAGDEESPPSALRPGRTLLQDLLCAALHSRASYGFAMAAGHVSSVEAYIKLQTLQSLTFNAASGASVAANNEAVAALAGIAPDDILYSQWKNDVYRPTHYVAIDRAHQCVVVSIRGSLEPGDLLSNLSAHPLEMSLQGVDGFVHEGIFAAATYIHCSTKDALEQASKIVPGWPVMVCGHSLGGGVAALVTMLLRGDDVPSLNLGTVTCVTMGTAAVMSKSLAELASDCVTSVIVGADVVPHLSYASVEKLLMEMSEASPVRQTVERVKSKLLGVGSSDVPPPSWGPIKSAAALHDEGHVKERGLASVLPPTGTTSPSPASEYGERKEEEEEKKKKKEEEEGVDDGKMMIPIIDLASEEPPETQLARQKQKQPEAHPLCLQSDQEEDATEWGESWRVAAEELRQEHDVILPMAPDADLCGLRTGLAQTVGPPYSSSSCGADRQRQQLTSSSASVLNEGGPELLFPPGRILWIFPPIEEEDEDQRADQNPPPKGQSAVNMDEALNDSAKEKNDADDDDTKRDANNEQQQQTESLKAVSVVADADRETFERILLLPEMLTDHLPDTYLNAIQQM